MKRLTRGSATPADLRNALDELGVALGEDFVIDKAPTRVDIDHPLPDRRYDGDTTDGRDVSRLDAQMKRVREFMADGEWHTSDEISTALGDEWASINARLRDLRKEKFGSYVVEARRVEGGNGLHEYRVLAPEIAQTIPAEPQPVAEGAEFPPMLSPEPEPEEKTTRGPYDPMGDFA